MTIAWLFGTLILSYALGSIPFGLLLSRMFGVGDLRKVGSGNIGATNVLRSGHKWLALATLILDAAKGISAVWLATYIYNAEFAPIAGLFAVIGHVFPVWLQFKGGKGVATAIGVFFAINWLLGLSICVIWVCVFAITRFSSLSSIFSIGYSSVAAYVFDNYLTAILCLNIAALIIFTHRHNIKRLVEGTEHSFSQRNGL
jgi:glycerol-3-phosphate acyltransferase PlsY